MHRSIFIIAAVLAFGIVVLIARPNANVQARISPATTPDSVVISPLRDPSVITNETNIALIDPLTPNVDIVSPATANAPTETASLVSLQGLINTPEVQQPAPVTETASRVSAPVILEDTTSSVVTLTSPLAPTPETGGQLIDGAIALLSPIETAPTVDAIPSAATPTEQIASTVTLNETAPTATVTVQSLALQGGGEVTALDTPSTSGSLLLTTTLSANGVLTAGLAKDLDNPRLVAPTPTPEQPVQVASLDITANPTRPSVSTQAGSIQSVVSFLNTNGGLAAEDILTQHIVQPGESLASLAKRYYGDHELYPKIFDANITILSRPDRLKVGQELVIPKL